MQQTKIHEEGRAGKDRKGKGQLPAQQYLLSVRCFAPWWSSLGSQESTLFSSEPCWSCLGVSDCCASATPPILGTSAPERTCVMCDGACCSEKLYPLVATPSAVCSELRGPTRAITATKSMPRIVKGRFGAEHSLQLLLPGSRVPRTRAT